MEPDTPKQWPSAQIDTTITVFTPWIRCLLFQLTMADPVKVMLVTVVTDEISAIVAETTVTIDSFTTGNNNENTLRKVQKILPNATVIRKYDSKF